MDDTLLLYEIEEMAKIGSYEADLVSHTWRGSQNFIKIFGLPVKEKYSQDEFRALVHPEDLDRVMQTYHDCLAHEEEFNCDYRCIKPNGQVIYVHSRSKIIRAEDHTPIRIVGVKQDITEMKLKSIQLDQLNELLHQKSEVLAHVAHDLKSPLNSIEGLIGIFKSQHDVHNDPKLWDLMENACSYASELISDLMDMSEMENVFDCIPRQNLNINTLVRVAIDRLEMMADKKNILIKTSFSEDAHAPANPVKMIRAFTNLLSNAIKFSFKDGVISISTTKTDTAIRVSIQDKGIGMHADEIKQLFGRFSKVTKKGTSGEKSTGLGLYIVKQIVDLHEGKIYVESQLHQGSTFHIELPLA